MGGEGRLKRRIAVHENQLVIPCEECSETADAECAEESRMPLHQRAECSEMQGDIAAEQEDEPELPRTTAPPMADKVMGI